MEQSKTAVSVVPASAALEEFLAALAAEAEQEKVRVIPNVSKIVGDNYVILTETSAKKGTKYISVRELGNSKIMGFGRPIYKLETDGSNTDEIVAWALDIKEVVDGILEDGKVITTRKGYTYTIKKMFSEKAKREYWAVTDAEGKIKGLANQRYSQIVFSFRLEVPEVK